MSNKNVLDYRLICVSESRGLQNYTARLANALFATGTVKLSVAGQTSLLSMIEPAITSVVIPSERRSLRTFIAIVNAIFTSRGAILHYQGINLFTLLLLAIAGRLGWRVVLTPHNVETHFRNRAYNAIKWILWRSFKMIILHTDAEVKLVPKDLLPRIAILPHGEYSPTEKAAPVSEKIVEAVSTIGSFILAPGFVRDDKNLGYLLDNAPLIASHGLTLIVAGQNKSSLASDKIAGCAVHFDGFLTNSDLDYLISHAMAVVLPYDKISESGILHQALSVGTPVIASDLPGFRERIRVGKTGWILKGLTTRSLDEALTAMKCAPLDRAKIANEHRKAFAWSSIAKRLIGEIDARRFRNE